MMAWPVTGLWKGDRTMTATEVLTKREELKRQLLPEMIVLVRGLRWANLFRTVAAFQPKRVKRMRFIDAIARVM